VQCISAQPSSGFHGLEGLKHMPTAIVPGIYDEKLADRNLWIETEDAYAMVRRLAREEGLLVGISSGCNVHAALMVAREVSARGQSATIVTVLCDSADKYLSEPSGRMHDSDCFRSVGGHGGTRAPRLSERMLWRHARVRRGGRKDVRVALPLETRSRASRTSAMSCGRKIWLAADRAARERRMDLIGIYHSHPDCDAYFSETDLKNSCPWYSFLVLSIRYGFYPTPIAGCRIWS